MCDSIFSFRKEIKCWYSPKAGAPSFKLPMGGGGGPGGPGGGGGIAIFDLFLL